MLLVSDAHFAASHEHHQALLAEFLERSDAAEIVLVGDVADVWWGWRSTVYAAYIPILGALWRIVQRGTPVTWIRGNHDFRLDAVADLGIAVSDRWERTVGGVRYLAVHGDAADARLRSRILTRMLRGVPGRVGARIAGPDLTWSSIRLFSRISRRHKGDWRAVLEAQMRWADGFLGRYADVVLVGHTHAPGIAERASGTFVNLGDWLDHRSYARIDAAGVSVWQHGLDGEVRLDGPPARRVP